MIVRGQGSGTSRAVIRWSMTAMARPALLYFLLWLGVTLSSAMDLEKRIVGGHDCPDSDRLYHVRLRIFEGTNEYVCGGSLIRDQWVLTAAHCVEPGYTVKVVVNVHPGGEKEEMDIADIDVIEEPNGHDIMLLKLPKKPQKTNKIDIPDANDCKSDIKEGDKFEVAGQGRNEVDKKNRFLRKYPTKLTCIKDVPVVKCGTAESMILGHRPTIPHANAFCAQTPGKDTAKGDSGGGVLFNNKIYGIVAGGHPTHAFAEPFYFVRVCKYLAWIESTAKN